MSMRQKAPLLPIHRRHEAIGKETLCLVANSGIGPDCELVDCAIDIADPTGVLLLCSRFINTQIEVSRVCKHWWQGCFFNSCRFKGKFYGSYFGIESDECRQRECGVKTCDFTEARLDLCSFFNCTPNDLALPRWPHVTVFHPGANAADFADVVSDPLLHVLNMSVMEKSPKVVAITFYLPAEMRRSRRWIMEQWELHKIFARTAGKPEPPEPVLSLDNVRKLLETKPYVFM
jgi:hypothetical protein